MVATCHICIYIYIFIFIYVCTPSLGGGAAPRKQKKQKKNRMLDNFKTNPVTQRCKNGCGSTVLAPFPIKIAIPGAQIYKLSMHSKMQTCMTTKERGVSANRAPTSKPLPQDPQTKPPASKVTERIQTGA